MVPRSVAIWSLRSKRPTKESPRLKLAEAYCFRLVDLYFCCDQPGDPISPHQTNDTLQVSHEKVFVLACSSRDVCCRAACGDSTRLLQICNWHAGHLDLARSGKFNGPSNTGLKLGTMPGT